jgi:WD40 repeat protein/outer membrane protein OmpA-like peptidoglycan-associated protein/Mg-chelatase subunit ChlD
MKDFSMIKRKLFLFFVFVSLILTGFQARGQYFNVYDINVQDYPVVRAKFVNIDSMGNFITPNDNHKFQIHEKNENAEIVDVEWPKKVKPKKLSVILAFDVSSSMDKERLSIAKSAARQFIDLFPLDVSECAISSFDHLNYLNQDFSHSKEKLKKAIDQIYPKGGTNYNSGFIYPFSGSLQVAKKGRFKKVIIFLTDGQGEGDKEQIINMAKQLGATVYPVTIEMEAPPVLKDIAKETGGIYYENVTNKEDAKDIYKRILYNSQTIKYGTISWLSPNGCSGEISAQFNYQNDTLVTSYKLPLDKQTKLQINPYYIQFESNDSLRETMVKLKAINKDFEITNIVFEQSEKFKINNGILPLNIPAGDSREINFVLDSEKEGKNFTQVSLENDNCPDYHLYAMYSDDYSTNLELEFPNGGEVFPVGIPVKIQWKGIHKNDSVDLFFSPDNGKNWTSITKSSGLAYSWNIPANPSQKCKVKVVQGKKQSKKNLRYLFSLSGNSNLAHYAKIVKDGELIVTTGRDHQVRLWSGNTGRYIRNFPLHRKWIYSVNESPDGNRLVSASDDGTAKVFYPESGRGSRILRANNWGINDAKFTHDGRRILTAGDDGAIRVWNARTGDHIYRMMGHQGWVRDLTISRSDNYAGSGGDDNTVRIWDLKTGSLSMTLLGHTDWVTDVDFNPKGDRIASASRDSTIIVWNPYSGRVINYIDDHKGEVNTIEYSSDGKLLLSSSKDGTFRIWNAKNGKMKEMVAAPDRKYYRTAYFGPSGTRIVTTDSEGNTDIWVYNKSESIQEDASDYVFSIVDPKPSAKDIHFREIPVSAFRDSVFSDFLINNTRFPVYIKEVKLRGKQNFRMISSINDEILNPGDSAALEISFQPESSGKATQKIDVITLTDTISAVVDGIGLEPAYQIINDQINFGKLSQNTSKDTSVAILQNTGKTDIKLANINLNGPGASSFILSKVKRTELKPGERWNAHITFKPQTRERVTGQLRFRVAQWQEDVLLFGELISEPQVSLQGQVFSSTDSLPLSADVAAYDLQTNRQISSATTSEKGKFSMILNPGRKYRVLAEKDQYIPSSIHLDLSKKISDHVEKNIYISPIQKGIAVRLNNIFFEFGKWKLTNSSRAELNRLVRFLNSHPGLEIVIEGHTDNIGTKDDNLALSKNRAMAVKKYLVEKGIDPGRLKAEGHGESIPVAPNNTPEGRAENRRVEFKIAE